MNILNKIIARKKEEVAENKKHIPVSRLESAPLFKRTCFSFKECIQDKNKAGIIAEFKRRSPSRGMLNESADVANTTAGYARAGASAISVLTDKDFFNGSNEHLTLARQASSIPILRKDFMIDEYQIIEAKSIGADAILLIAAVLSVHETERLAKVARSFGLQVVLEIHDEYELDHLNDFIDITGINNRNLKNFNVDIQTSLKLGDMLPREMVKISESGISKPETIQTLQEAGFHGFLIGETFMKEPDPAAACARLCQELKVQSKK